MHWAFLAMHLSGGPLKVQEAVIERPSIMDVYVCGWKKGMDKKIDPLQCAPFEEVLPTLIEVGVHKRKK